MIQGAFVKPCGQGRVGPASFVMALSVGLAICGIFMAISAKMFDSTKMTEEFKPARDKKDLVVTTMIAVAAILFVTGLWGIATYKIKNRIFISIFGLAAAAMAVICFGFGAIFNALANLSDNAMESVCPALAIESTGSPISISQSILSFEPFQEVADSVKDIDALNDLSSYYMCSPTCPCLQPSEATIEGWSDEQNWLNIEEKVLKGLERTKEVETATFFNLMIFYTAE